MVDRGSSGARATRHRKPAVGAVASRVARALVGGGARAVAAAASLAAGAAPLGCGGPLDDGLEHEDEALGTAALGVHDADAFNHPGVRHDHQYVQLKSGSAPLRDLDGTPTGATVKNTPIKGHCKAHTGPCIRLQGLEVVDSPAGKLAYVWGINGSRSGHVRVADLEHAPEIDAEWRKGNGKPCAAKKDADGKPLAMLVTPRPIPGTLRYRGKTYDEVFSFKWYGQPGAIAGLPDYTYLSWSWINEKGGGIVRALVSVGDVFYPCNVEPITSHAISQKKCDAYPSQYTCEPGWVKAMYGKIYNGESSVYGWLVHSHRFKAEPIVYHLAEADPP